MKKAMIYGSNKNLDIAKSLGCKLIGFEHSSGKECWIQVPEKQLSKIKAIFKPTKIEILL